MRISIDNDKTISDLCYENDFIVVVLQNDEGEIVTKQLYGYKEWTIESINTWFDLTSQYSQFTIIHIIK